MSDKSAASFHMANHLKDRSGRRPIRVSTLLKNEKKREISAKKEKTSSASGADLRTPLMGGTRFPTQDSTAFAQKQLKSSQNAAELNKPQPTTLKDVTPDIKAPGSMPKIGADMTIENDPLIQHLKKCADVLESNHDDAPVGPTVDAKTLEDTIPNLEVPEERCRALIKEMFDNGESMRDKDTTHEYEEGVVDRILKL